LQGTPQYWVVMLVASYVVGQILLAVTDWLNYVAGYVAWVLPKCVSWVLIKIFRKEIPQRTPESARRFDSDSFHEALSWVRLRNAAAAGEIDHHMADYKLLRNLVAVFMIDAVWALVDKTPKYRAAVDGLLALLSFGGFVRMHYWANRLALQYRDLISDAEKRGIIEE